MNHHSILTDDEICELAAHGFRANLPCPQLGELPYHITMYRMIYDLLWRLSNLEESLQKHLDERNVRP